MLFHNYFTGEYCPLPFFVMTKLCTKLTINQLKRLENAVKSKVLIPKDIRKKLYLCVKTNLKTKDGIIDALMNEIEIRVGYQSFDVLICIPKSEISLEAYYDFLGETPDEDYDENKWDEFNIQGYKNRILFLQYLIDKL